MNTKLHSLLFHVRVLGDITVITSPDVEGLYVADVDPRKALSRVPASVEKLQELGNKVFNPWAEKGARER